MTTTLAVTGASGQLAQRVLHHLLETEGVTPARVIALSRTPAKLAQWQQRGVATRAADFDDEAGLTAALQGIDRLLLVSTDALDRPGRRLAQHQRAIAAAAQAGVAHLVYTSMPNPATSPIPFAPDHLGSEEAIAASGIAGWTILRNHWYFENLFLTLPNVLKSGSWPTATAQGQTADISRDDLARAAATVLASQRAGRDTFTLSGAQALTIDEQAQTLSTALDRPIAVAHMDTKALINGMVEHGVPEPLAQFLASFDSNTAAGHVSRTTADYEQLTGRPPTLFADWVRGHKDALLAAGA